jgi:3-oxoacyl-[acyl-carrier-protein] synthase-3
MNADVFITRTAAYLPFDPVGNDEMEAVLGMVGNRPSRARRIILRNNGIQQRHYAIDRATGQPAMSHAELTARAVRGLGHPDEIGAVDCLATGTSKPDQLVPNHGVMVHGQLGWPQLQVVALAGICLSGAAALKYAAMSVATGDSRRAVATGSELVSALMMAKNFDAEVEHRVAQLEERPEIAFEKDFLRWMLSDGAGAALLESQPAKQGPSLRVKWIELFSFAHLFPACMYAGAEKLADGTLRGWDRYPAQELVDRSVMTLKQDVRLLNEEVMVTVREPLKAIQQKYGLRPEQIDWYLPHVSSMYFAPRVDAAMHEVGFGIPRDKWFTNLVTCGNTGSASPYIMLDELFRSGRLRAGQNILMYVPESGRFSSGFILLEVA